MLEWDSDLDFDDWTLEEFRDAVLYWRGVIE